jgi:serine/threonine protein kinase/tetratricopeptide (TPR) repeat protein
MLVCQKCKRSYDHGYRFCPIDGAELDDVDPIGDPLLNVTIGRYHVLAKVYESDLAVVYRADDPLQKRKIFIWVFDPAFVAHVPSYERFQKEVMRSKAVAHNNIVAHYELGHMEDGRYFLVTEAPHGFSLAEVFKKERPLQQRRVIQIARQICSALKTAHEQGTYHSNLNPNYIYVPRDHKGWETVKISNFGVAKLMADYKLALVEQGRESDVSPSDVAYLSPEHASGGSEITIDERDDIYSLGVLLYEMLSGDLPFEADSAQAMIDAHSLVNPISIRVLKPDLDVSPKLDAMVLKAMSKNRRKRYESMGEMLEELDALAQEADVAQPGAEATVPLEPALLHKSESGFDGSKAELPPPQTNADVRTGEDIESVIRRFTRPTHREDGTPAAADSLHSDKTSAVPPPFEPMPSPASESNSLAGHEAQRAGRGARLPVSWKRVFLYAALPILLIVTAFTVTFLSIRFKPKYGKLSIKTDPPDSVILVDGMEYGRSPFYVERVESGPHIVKAVKEGYKEDVQPVNIKPDSLETVFFKLTPLSAGNLSSEQLKKISDLMRRAKAATKENILVPPPEEYNVLYFCNKILEIDPADPFALDTRTNLADKYRSQAMDAYQKGNWFKAEEHFKNVALIFPNDEMAKKKLAELAGKLEEVHKDRQKKVAELTAKIKQALQSNSLVPPEPENAIDNVNYLLRLDKQNGYAKQSKERVRDLLQKRADSKMAASNWEGARADYFALQQYFPTDRSTQGKLELINKKLDDQQRLAETVRTQQEQEKQRRAEMQETRQQGVDAFKAKDYSTAIALLGKVIAAGAANDEIYYYLGAAYLQTQQFENAITNFEKCVSVNSRHAMAHFNLGILYESQRQNFARAKHHLARARDLGGIPGYPPERIARLIQEIEGKERLTSMAAKPIPIEHKHFGSACQGNLFVSSSGIRFETTSGHGFSESLDNVQVLPKPDHFELRVHNKKFNFRCLSPDDTEQLLRLLRVYKKI